MYALDEREKSNVIPSIIAVFFIVFIIIFGVRSLRQHNEEVRESALPFEQVQMVKIGMDQEDVFYLLGEVNWSSYDDYGFHYKWRFITPNDEIGTFWVTINDEEVVSLQAR